MLLKRVNDGADDPQGEVPTTLAEFTFDAGDGHTYYDISLVDGYNLPIAIQMLPESNTSFQNIPQRLTNPSCVGTVGEAQNPGYNPYSGGQTFLGTTAQHPLQFENNETRSDIAQWCPWALQTQTSSGPNGGVYVYPDGQLNRPAFDPCLSACAKYNQPQDCCTGAYDSPSSCTPSQYSKSAKAVCPDAYSYGRLFLKMHRWPMLMTNTAFDDQTSTFIIPSGAGFEVIFCPGARSTNIIATSKNELVQLAQTGRTSSTSKEKRELFAVAETFYITEVHHNATYVASVSSDVTSRGVRNNSSMLALAMAVTVLVAFYGHVVVA